MDRSADPCNDFDRFVCGRFNDEANIPDKTHGTDLTTTGVIYLFLANYLVNKFDIIRNNSF